MLSTIAEIQKGQGLGSGNEWLAELVSRVYMAGLVFRVCMGVRIFRGSKYHVTVHALYNSASENALIVDAFRDVVKKLSSVSKEATTE